MKRVFAVMFIIICLASMLTGCKYDDMDENYTPSQPFTLPQTKTEKEGSVPYVIASLAEDGITIRDYIEMRADLIGAEEGYSIRVNGITMELYRFAPESAMLLEIKQLGAYPVKDENGQVLKTVEAHLNGSFVLLVTRNKNDQNKDISDLNKKVVDKFMKLKLS